MQIKLTLVIFGIIFLILGITLVVSNFDKIINSKSISYETCLKRGIDTFSMDRKICGLGDEKDTITKPAYTIIFWALISIIGSMLCLAKAFGFNKVLPLLSGLFTASLGGMLTFPFNSGSPGLTITSLVLLIFGVILTLWGIKRIFSHR